MESILAHIFVSFLFIGVGLFVYGIVKTVDDKFRIGKKIEIE